MMTPATLNSWLMVRGNLMLDNLQESSTVRLMMWDAARRARRAARPPTPKREPKAPRIFKPDLLPHQVELLRDISTKILGLCSGFGGGKSWSAARKVVQLLLLNPGYDGIVTEPTLPLLVKIMYPELEAAFDSAGLKWKFNKQDKIYYVWVKGVKTRVLCDSMENYTRLIGVNAAWIVCDEFDTTKMDIALAAYEKLLGRLRVGKVRQFVIVSTPEGFRAMYHIFVKKADDEKRLIKAKSTDNTWLASDYIETMRKNYPPALVDAYINGEFVNLNSGAVYKSFSRTENACNTVIADDEPELIVGMDFNVTKMAAVVYVRRQRHIQVEIVDEDTGQVQQSTEYVEEIHAVGEFYDLYDTPAMIDAIFERYPEYAETGRVNVYPDSSGKSRKTVNASKSDIALLEEAGFTVTYESTNPPVKDRIMAMNAMMCNANGLRRYFINVDACPRTTECLEQQVYDPKTGEPDKKAGVDHTNDAAGYPVVHIFPVLRPVMDNTAVEVNFY